VAKLENLLKFKRMLIFCLKDWWLGPLSPVLGYITGKRWP